MQKRRLLIGLMSALVLVAALSVSPIMAQSPVEVSFWHAMSGNNGKVVTDLVAKYNASQTAVHVTEQNKGNYNETLNAVIQAAGQGQGPDIAQIFDLGTPLAVDSGFFIPAETAFSADQITAIKADVLAPVLNYFTIGGKLNSIPWNNSTPLFYYNKDMFTAAGLDPEKPPATWQELETDCEKIKAANAAPYCISMQVYGWYFEQWMALQGQELANNGNGRADRATETNITSAPAKNIMTFWKDLNDKGYWTYTGKLHDNQGANQIFISKQAAMIVESTGALNTFKTGADTSGFQLGTGFFPTNGDVDRDGVIIGGASLWIGAGHPAEETKGATDFIMWLMAPEQMTVWHKGTGYLPITKSSQDALTAEGYFTANPGTKTAIDQLAAAKVDSATAGALMGAFPQIRDIMEQTIQTITSGEDIDATLADAKSKADAAIADYNSRLTTPDATPEATAAS
ncbi:MAG: ABC transporter substrate-binding protein [Anaerolineae bacterium]|nr:ABC transporter substrate-binding protein [Anaerolineae bacterium]